MTQQIKVNVDVFQMIKIHHVVQKLYMHDGCWGIIGNGPWTFREGCTCMSIANDLGLQWLKRETQGFMWVEKELL